MLTKTFKFYDDDEGEITSLTLIGADLNTNKQPNLYCDELRALAVNPVQFHFLTGTKNFELIRANLIQAKEVSAPTFNFFTTPGNRIKYLSDEKYRS